MSRRSRKLLSLLLAVAMVFSMTTVAFGGEKTKAAAVLAEETKVSLSSNVLQWHAYDYDPNDGDNLMARYFVGVATPGEKKTATSDHIFDGKVILVSDVNSNWTTDEVEGSYYYGNMASIESYGKILDNKKWQCQGMTINGWRGSVSTNVFDLGNNAYLLVAYRVNGSIGLNKNGTNVPIVAFNGKKYVDVSKAPKNGKLDKNNSSIYVEAAIVTQEAGKAPVLVANSLSENVSGKTAKPMISISVSPKNNQYANVSMNASRDDKGKNIGHAVIENSYVKSGTYPYFTISVKTDKSLKSYNVKKAKDALGVDIKKAEFKFDICRNSFAEWTAGDTVSEGDISKDCWWDDVAKEGFRHNYPGPADPDGSDNLTNNDGHLIYFRNIVCQTKYGSQSLGRLDLVTDAKKIGKNVPVYIELTPSGEQKEVTNSSGYSKSYKFLTYKLKANKDYTVDTSLGNNVLLLKPAGNFEGDGATFRNAEVTGFDGKKTTQVRCGIAKLKTDGSLDTHYYVDSVD